MKNWYQNRMETGVNHRGFNVPKDKFLYLTDAQAKVHNKGEEQRVAKVDSSPKKDDVAVLADWDEYESFKANPESESKEGEITTEKEEKSQGEAQTAANKGLVRMSAGDADASRKANRRKAQ